MPQKTASQPQNEDVWYDDRLSQSDDNVKTALSGDKAETVELLRQYLKGDISKAQLRSALGESTAKGTPKTRFSEAAQEASTTSEE